MSLTFLQAITQIEKRVAQCGMKWGDGSPMEPIVAMGKIGRWHGDRYNHVIDSFDAGVTSVETYFLEMIRMISEYQARERPL